MYTEISPLCKLLRDRPFNLQRGGYGFFFRSEFFFRTRRELVYLFFCFFQNLTLGYMTKTEPDYYFFPPPKSEYFFSNIGNQNIFFRKKTYPPLPPGS